MTSLTSANIKMALQAIRNSKLRSSLTMLGIIIGVASVITAVSLGEGIKRQVADTVKTSGDDIINVRSGNIIERDHKGNITKVNYLSAFSSTLTEQDYQTLTKLPDIETIVPISTISALPSNAENQSHVSLVVATTDGFPGMLKQRIAYGNFFGSGQLNRQVAIVGQTVAEKLYKENVPIGQILKLRDQEFIVIGVFDKFENSTFTGGNDFNNAIFIPYQTGKVISNNAVHLQQLLVRPKPGKKEPVLATINQSMLDNHGQQQDFAVLRQEETLSITGQALTLATSFVASIAAISLVVGGIGIMNIMFVSVIERTREIGIRKSLGATNRQIYGQFLTEATLISLAGGVLGILLSFLANFIFRISTDLKPAITLPVIGAAVMVSTTIGIVFGTIPAAKAARKDPIESLRYE
jgi:putative ABC transport system permease protein